MPVNGQTTETAGDGALELEENFPLTLYDPHLVEEGIFFALRGHPEAKDFERERNRLYEITDLEERERAFHDLHRTWFPRLRLADEIEKALHEQGLTTSVLKTCVIACASGKKEEGADLLVSNEDGLEEKDRRTLRLLLRPQSLLDTPSLRIFLRHELFHIRDMVDPDFGYKPALPAAEAGPTHDLMMRDRYRSLWDTTIDGRMDRRGWATGTIRAERINDFARSFPMFGEETARMFSRFFDHEPHTHAEFVAFASDPRAVLEGPRAAAQPGSRCPLCHFPSYVFEPNPDGLSAETTREIYQDFPRWRPAQGLCLQCADLYRARFLTPRPIQ